MYNDVRDEDLDSTVSHEPPHPDGCAVEGFNANPEDGLSQRILEHGFRWNSPSRIGSEILKFRDGWNSFDILQAVCHEFSFFFTNGKSYLFIFL
jgi:hypothetical protein